MNIRCEGPRTETLLVYKSNITQKNVNRTSEAKTDDHRRADQAGEEDKGHEPAGAGERGRGQRPGDIQVRAGHKRPQLRRSLAPLKGPGRGGRVLRPPQKRRPDHAGLPKAARPTPEEGGRPHRRDRRLAGEVHRDRKDPPP